MWGSPGVTRDVLYSDDLVRAIVLSLNRDDIKFDTFNIGSGLGITVDNVVKWSLRYADHIPSKIIYNQNRPTTIRYRVLDRTKAKEILGWEPKYSIEEGIKNTIKWWIENRNWWRR